MTVDNFDKVIDFMKFSSPDDFYFLQIIQRKKDGNNTGRGNNGARLIKAYYIRSAEHLLLKKDKIIELCLNNNARAYIGINKRSFFKVSCGCQQALAKLIMEGNTYQAPRIWDHVCGELPALSGKDLYRLVDVDKLGDNLSKILTVIKKCRGNSDPESRIKEVFPTQHGYHIITSKFDVEQFKQELAILNIDSPTILRDASTLVYYDPRHD